MAYQHAQLAAEKWHTLSLAEQLGNIGSEVGRAAKWKDKDPRVFEGAIHRALELFDLTISDSRWRARLKEIIRAREIFCDALSGGDNYGSSLEMLEQYFFHFALFTRLQK